MVESDWGPLCAGNFHYTPFSSEGAKEKPVLRAEDEFKMEGVQEIIKEEYEDEDPGGGVGGLGL